MHMYRCMYVYLYMPFGCIHLGMYIDRHMSVCACIYTYMSVCIYAIIYLPRQTYMSVCRFIHILNIYMHTPCMYAMYVHDILYVCIYINPHIVDIHMCHGNEYKCHRNKYAPFSMEFLCFGRKIPSLLDS